MRSFLQVTFSCFFTLASVFHIRGFFLSQVSDNPLLSAQAPVANQRAHWKLWAWGDRLSTSLDCLLENNFSVLVCPLAGPQTVSTKLLPEGWRFGCQHSGATWMIRTGSLRTLYLVSHNKWFSLFMVWYSSPQLCWLTPSPEIFYFYPLSRE